MDHDIIYDRLTAHSGLSALTALRWYPLVLPQSPTLPAGTYQRISAIPIGETADITRQRVQFSCYADDYIEARAIAAQVIAAFDGYVDADQVTKLRASWSVNTFEFYEPDTKSYVVPVDMIIIIL